MQVWSCTRRTCAFVADPPFASRARTADTASTGAPAASAVSSSWPSRPSSALLRVPSAVMLQTWERNAWTARSWAFCAACCLALAVALDTASCAAPQPPSRAARRAARRAGRAGAFSAVHGRGGVRWRTAGATGASVGRPGSSRSAGGVVCGGHHPGARSSTPIGRPSGSCRDFHKGRSRMPG